MAEDNYPQQPSGNLANNQKPNDAINVNQDKTTFPYDLQRIANYEFFERLFFGHHFDAFNIRMQSDNFGKEYAKMRYVVANFPGLISKVIADLLFIEPPKIQVPDGDQKFVDALVSENKLRTQSYESALANSYYGDTVFKLRVGKRNPDDTKPTVIIEEITPKIYFPKINPYNVKEEPEEKELAWKVAYNGKEYLRCEIHYAGRIENKVYELEGNKIKAQVDGTYIGLTDLKPVEKTFINKSLIVHIPNWRAGARHFGISDYYDLETLFFAMNNRITKIDNILDKHSDPILAIPDGILDENGKVKKGKIGLFQRPPDADKNADPSYITWDANLESAMTEIEKLIDMTLMMSETAPGILGMDKGGFAESGRALKFKLLRTLAKAQRKQLYYREGLIDIIYRAQLLAKELSLEVDGVKLTKAPVKPEIVWSDGLPADMTELIDIESKRIDAGLTTKADSIMRIDDVDRDTAEKKAKEIDDENKIELPVVNTAANANSFGKNGESKNQNAGNNNQNNNINQGKSMSE